MRGVRSAGLVAGLWAAGMSSGCSPENNKVVSDWDRNRQERESQKTQLSIDQFRGDPVDVAAYGIFRVLEAQNLFEQATGGAIPQARCQSRREWPFHDGHKTLEVRSENCRFRHDATQGTLKALEHFDTDTYSVQGHVSVRRVAVTSSYYVVELERRKDSHPVNGNVSWRESRDLRVILDEASVSNEGLLRYRFHYTVDIPKLEQELYQNDYKVNEYDGALHIAISGVFFVDRETRKVAHVEDLDATVRREGLRNIAKREKSGRFTRFERKFSSFSAFDLGVSAFSDKANNRVWPLSFSGDCAGPAGKVFVRFDPGRREGSFRGGVEIAASEWRVDPDGRVKTLEHCARVAEPGFGLVPHDLLFFR